MVLGDNNQNRTFSIPTILENSKQQFNKQQIKFFYSLTQFTIYNSDLFCKTDSLCTLDAKRALESEVKMMPMFCLLSGSNKTPTKLLQYNNLR